MELRQATPDGGGRSRPDSFAYYWTEPNQPWTGWCAGPIRWIKAHTSDSGSKPCLAWITFNHLPCLRCRPAEVPADIGYLCVYRETDNAPILVVLHDNMFDTCKSLKYGEYLRMSRPGGPDGVVSVQIMLNKKHYVTTLARRKKAIDSTPMLLKMWKIPELTSWYECQSMPALTVAPPPPPPPEVVVEGEYSPKVRQVIKEVLEGLGLAQRLRPLTPAERQQVLSATKEYREAHSKRNGDGH